MEFQASNSKGRNADLIQFRNRKLAARFYFYSCIIGLKFSKCLEKLSPEFDISQSRICDLLSENADIVSRMEKNATSLQELKQEYPYFNWQYQFNKPIRQLSLFEN